MTQREKSTSTLRLTVPPELEGQRLDVVIARLAPAVSRRMARRLVEDGAVHLDGKRIQVCSRPQRLGARIEVFLAAAERASAPAPRILFIDEMLVVVDKAAGVPTEPTREGSKGTLKAALEQYFKEGAKEALKEGLKDGQPDANEQKNEQKNDATRFLHAVHRLDTDTTGVVIFARSAEAAHAVGRQLHDATAVRRYLAVVSGLPEWTRARLDWPLTQTRDAAGHIRVDPNGAPALTLVTVLATGKTGALVLCAPETGRTHQIRVHLARAGHPLVGDRRYREIEMPAEGQPRKAGHLGLHALTLSCIHPNGSSLRLAAPPPPEFLKEAEIIGIPATVVASVVEQLLGEGA